MYTKEEKNRKLGQIKVNPDVSRAFAFGIFMKRGKSINDDSPIFSEREREEKQEGIGREGMFFLVWSINWFCLSFLFYLRRIAHP